MFKLAFIINPFAGAGGPTARKGSDAADTREDLIHGRIAQTSPARAKLFLQTLSELISPEQLVLQTVAGDMGGKLAKQTAFQVAYLNHTPAQPSTCEDTAQSAKAAKAASVDLVVFVGGDGTARDVCNAIGGAIPCLGVPAGVKMQSAVHAISPQAAARVVSHLVNGDLVNVADREVRDLDEAAYKQGRIVSQFHGHLRVPDEPQFVQHVKQGGVEVDALVLSDMADHLSEALAPDTLLVVGPGRTMFDLCEHLNLPSTLLGVDVYLNGSSLQADVSADELYTILQRHQGPKQLWLTVIGGQGHILGRGNQQLSVPALRCIGRDNIQIIASRTKLLTLSGRPLLVDSGDAEYDQSWHGYASVVAGYHDQVLYPVVSGANRP